MEQPDLFLDPDAAPDGEPSAQLTAPPNGVNLSTRGTAGVSEWNEVPQALFDSWSPSRQLSYCAARDEHSATHDLCDVLDPNFYRSRAASYKEMMHE